MRHGLRLVDQAVETCCFNRTDPRTHRSLDIDPVNCAACVQQEAMGLQSYRQGANQRWGLDHDHDLPLVLDVSPNRNCNLACRICDEYSSSTWARLKSWPIPDFYNQTPEQWQTRLAEFDLSRVQEINFSGGEPLLNRNLVRYLGRLESAMDFSKISLRFSTNGTIEFSDQVLEFLSRFRLVQARFSIDDIGPWYEYQRGPSRWPEVEHNWQHFLDNLPSTVMPAINRTISVFNISRLEALNQWLGQWPKSRWGDTIELVDHFAEGVYHVNTFTQPVRDLVRQRSALGWQLIQDQPSVPDRPDLREALLAHDQLQRHSLEDVDPELYQAIMR